jgi:hypothetical protein
MHVSGRSCATKGGFDLFMVILAQAARGSNDLCAGRATHQLEFLRIYGDEANLAHRP